MLFGCNASLVLCLISSATLAQSGDLEPVSGWGKRDPKLRIGRYNQHFVDALVMDDTPVSYLMSKFSGEVEGLNIEMVRMMLGRFGLSGHHHLQPILKLSGEGGAVCTCSHLHWQPFVMPHHHKPCIGSPDTLSASPLQALTMLCDCSIAVASSRLSPRLAGGQKARVVFTAICLSRPHILLLDEPTNHLDMESIDALGEAIEEFSGGVVIISHDARLLSTVCADEERSEVWIVEDGKLKFYKGTFEDYR